MSFVPPYPKPHKNKSTLILRFLRGWHSWLEVLFERSYRMKMGHVRIFGFDSFMVNEPKWVARVLQENPGQFPKHHIMHRMLEPLLGNSIFTTNGKVWERQRRLVDIAFEKAGLKLVFPHMRGAVNDMLGRLDQVADGRSYEVDAEATYVTADVMFRTILSEELKESDADSIYRAFLEYQRHAHRIMLLHVYRLPVFFSERASRRAATLIREVLRKIITRRYEMRERGEPVPEDILGAMMEARDPVEGDGFDCHEMVDQICMLFLAGHETSATAMGWSLYLLSQCSHLQDQILAEIAEAIGEREIEFGDTNKLKTVYNVFREALRLYPPVGCLLREAGEDTQIRDKEVKKESLVLISPWLIQRHRELWDRPDEFDPARFETAEGKASAKCAYLPFSKGPRVCVGQGFAIQEAVLILASLVRRYRIEPDREHVPKPVGRVTLRSDNGIRVRFYRRPEKAAPPEGRQPESAHA